MQWILTFSYLTGLWWGLNEKLKKKRIWYTVDEQRPLDPCSFIVAAVWQWDNLRTREFWEGNLWSLQSVQFSCSVMSDSLRPYGLQDARPPCPSPTPGAYSISCPWSWWCHPTISSSVVLFSSCFQSFQASGSFPMSQFFSSGTQSIGVSALTL